MRYTTFALATVPACTAAPALEAHVSLPGFAMSMLTVPATPDTPIVKIKENKGKNGVKKAKGSDKTKVKHAQKKKPEHANDNKRDKINAKVKRSKDDRLRDSETILRLRAPDGRDMIALLSAVPIALLGADVVFADVPQDRLLTYRNCPPGLAKKDPPCVPPGLAKKGVTYEEWVTYDNERLDEIYLDQRRDYLDGGAVLEDDILLLSSAQISTLYGLRPTPEGERYALIDGQPVLLTDEDHTSLLWIHDLARVENLPGQLGIAPTAALTQDELRQTYNLPTLEAGYNYSVLNGELVTLEDSAYETLQMIRIARAIS